MPKNYVLAYKWYNLAAAQGNEQAVVLRSVLERLMTPQQIAEAQRLSAQFVPRKAGEETAPEISPPPSTINASATAFFVTEDGYALTSYHVITDAARVQIWTGSSALPARLVKSDPANHLALLKVSGKFPALPLQASRGVLLGETVFTVGFPNIVLQGLEPKLTGIFGNLTVQENLELATYPRKKSVEIREDLERLYSLFPRLEVRKHQRGSTLSGGEQQMLAVGRALMTGARFILLDEPSMGLAPLLMQELFRVLKQLNENGTTILVVEQNARLALKYAHRAYVMETGRVVMEGTPAEVLNDAQVIKAYLGG